MSAALDQIRAMDADCITPALAARVIGCDPYTISVYARDCPDLLPFPTFRIGNRTKIPRLPFLACFDGRAGQARKEDTP